MSDWLHIKIWMVKYYNRIIMNIAEIFDTIYFKQINYECFYLYYLQKVQVFKQYYSIWISVKYINFFLIIDIYVSLHFKLHIFFSKKYY